MEDPRSRSPILPTESPYLTILQSKFKPLELIDEKQTADALRRLGTLCNVNDSVVRLGVVHGSYHWHSHQQEDEFFYVVEGQLLIDLVDPDDPSSSEATLAPSPSTLVRGW